MSNSQEKSKLRSESRTDDERRGAGLSSAEHGQHLTRSRLTATRATRSLEQQPTPLHRYGSPTAPTCATGSYVGDARCFAKSANTTLDAPGATYLTYTPDGKKLITAGVDNYCRIFTTGSDDEPVTLDDCQENNAAVVAGVS